jgi:peptide-methionine (R)-S-oxide reductase
MNETKNSENCAFDPKEETRLADGKISLSDAEWQKKLTPEQFRILRQKGTEAPRTGKYEHFKGEGTFVCAACGNPLFSSDTKFDSGSGWPSFYDVATKGAVDLHEDKTYGMTRVEVTCKKCGGHLGHVFTDGPEDKTGLRYCINSASLDFKEEKKSEAKPKK